jgi:hypothetical protein
VAKKFQVALYHQHVMKLTHPQQQAAACNDIAGITRSKPGAGLSIHRNQRSRARRHPNLLFKKSLFTNHPAAITGRRGENRCPHR